MTGFEIIYSILMILVFTIIGVSLVYEKKARISPTPVLPQVRKKALSLIPEKFTATGEYNIADIGCGWGGLLMALSRRFPESSITGYEISPWPYVISKLRAGLSARNVAVRRENFFANDLSEFNLLFCYLSPWHMKELTPKLENLKAGSAVISCSFPIEGWDAERVESIRAWPVKISVFVYILK